MAEKMFVLFLNREHSEKEIVDQKVGELKELFGESIGNFALWKNLNSKRFFIIFNMDTSNVDIEFFQKKVQDSFLGRAIVMHKKNNCIFSINALKRLLLAQYGENVKDLEKQKNMEISWQNYHNILAMLNKNDVLILDAIRFIRNVEI